MDPTSIAWRLAIVLKLQRIEQRLSRITSERLAEAEANRRWWDELERDLKRLRSPEKES